MTEKWFNFYTQMMTIKFKYLRPQSNFYKINKDKSVLSVLCKNKIKMI